MSNLTVYNYRIWCVTEQAYVYVWSTTEPTTCPNNNGHTIDSSQTTIVNEVSTTNASTSDNRVLIAPSLIPLRYTFNFTCQGDDFTNGTRYNGLSTHFTLTNANSGSNTITVQFVDTVVAIGGCIRAYGTNSNDIIGINVVAPATPVTASSGGNTGNCDVVSNKIIPNVSNTGAYNVSPSTAANSNLLGPNPIFVSQCVPIPSKNAQGIDNGYWEWNENDGTIVPVSTQIGSYNLYTVPITLSRFVSNWNVWTPAGTLYNQEFFIGNHGSYILPQYQLQFICTWDASHGSSDVVEYQFGMYLGRKKPGST